MVILARIIILSVTGIWLIGRLHRLAMPVGSFFDYMDKSVCVTG
jgi:hypothetical protein